MTTFKAQKLKKKKKKLYKVYNQQSRQVWFKKKKKWLLLPSWQITSRFPLRAIDVERISILAAKLADERNASRSPKWSPKCTLPQKP